MSMWAQACFWGADNTRVMNRLVQCQRRQQSYPKLPDQLLTFWLGYQPDRCGLWLLSFSWDLNLPFPLRRWKWTKLHRALAVAYPTQGKENVPKWPNMQVILRYRAAKTAIQGKTVCMRPLSFLIQAWQESSSTEQFVHRLEWFTDLIKLRAFFNEEKMLPNSSL